MKILSKPLLVILAYFLFCSAECDTPLVDRQTEFFLTNESSQVIITYLGIAYQDPPRGINGGRTLPLDSSALLNLTYSAIPPNETGYIAIGTRGPNLFDELPDRILRIWIFEEEVFNQVPYDSIRRNPDLFELITLTEDEFEMMGDTLIIN